MINGIMLIFMKENEGVVNNNPIESAFNSTKKNDMEGTALTVIDKLNTHGDHLFSIYAKVSEKLIFLTP